MIGVSCGENTFKIVKKQGEIPLNPYITNDVAVVVFAAKATSELWSERSGIKF